MTLRTGLTTGTCAAAAAKAAVRALAQLPVVEQVEVTLPSGDVVSLPIAAVHFDADRMSAMAAVRKDGGDDADATHGMEIRATVAWDDSAEVTFAAGEGVGTITKPGLQIPPGQPAINPVPRRMIAAAVREVTERGVRVEIAIPGGRAVAAQTFNPRLGIEGGLSILGTTGIVRPYCQRAVLDALMCTVDVAAACATSPVLVPGNIGARAARGMFPLKDEQLIEVGNKWGFVLDRIAERTFRAVLLLGHPGKLAKLAEGHWDTHSSRSPAATGYLDRLCRETLGQPTPASPTVDGVFTSLAPDDRRRLAEVLAGRIGAAVGWRLKQVPSPPAPLPTNLQSVPVGEGSREPMPLPRPTFGRCPERAGVRGSETDADHADLSYHPPSPPAPLPLTGEGRSSASIAIVLIDMAGQPLATWGDLSPWS